MLRFRFLNQKFRILRFNSTLVPDNSPRAADNERWLEGLLTVKKRCTTIKGKKKLAAGSSNLTKFPLKILSSPPETPYIEVTAALSNFTSTSRLRDIKKSNAIQENFVDIRIIKCKSGSGGDGIVSFSRDANKAVGPPDGGDGGDGGNVYVRASAGINSLAKLRTNYIAGDGSNGGIDQLDGSKGKDALITVPVGTVVRWCLNPKDVKKYVLEQRRHVSPDASIRDILDQKEILIQCTGTDRCDKNPTNIQLFRRAYKPGNGWIFKGKDESYHRNKNWFIELNARLKNYDYTLYDSELFNDRFPLYGMDFKVAEEKPICLLRGGKGGLGNMHFLTNLIRNPRFSKSGRCGLESHFLFELKTIADLGLVGLPNAGKSTILNRISNARPKIGEWEFTTLSPSIGTVSPHIGKPSFTVVDIPGIIEHASQDKGMGIEFLRHIERSKGLVFVISISSEHPLKDLNMLIRELGGIEAVRTKNVLVVCNKADIDHENPQSMNKFEQIVEFCKPKYWDCIPISALKSENIDVLLDKMAECAGKAA